METTLILLIPFVGTSLGAAVFTLIFTRELSSVLPFLLAFASGVMMYVVIEELIPESQAGKHSNIGTAAAAFGFTVMMVLDVVFG